MARPVRCKRIPKHTTPPLEARRTTHKPQPRPRWSRSGCLRGRTNGVLSHGGILALQGGEDVNHRYGRETGRNLHRYGLIGSISKLSLRGEGESSIESSQFRPLVRSSSSNKGFRGPQVARGGVPCRGPPLHLYCRGESLQTRMADDVVVLRDEQTAYDDGTVVRVRLLRVPESERFGEGVKYALHYGAAGADDPIIRFDNCRRVHSLRSFPRRCHPRSARVTTTARTNSTSALKPSRSSSPGSRCSTSASGRRSRRRSERTGDPRQLSSSHVIA